MRKYRIQKYSVPIAVAHGALASFTAPATELNGILKLQKVKSSAAADSAATITLNIKDSDGDIVYSKASIAANTTTITDLTGDAEVPLSGDYTIQALFSANQTVTDQTVTVTLLIDRG